MSRSWVGQGGYSAIRSLCRLACIAGFQVRCRGRQRLPETGAALICANHQSFLDPVLIGLAFNRQINFLARENLFRFPLGSLLRFLNAIPLDRQGLGLSGMKESLRRLRRGEPLLIFPEGTRTADGEMGPLLPGTAALARRGRAPLLPVGIDGTYQAWPRHRALPLPAIVDVVIGEPISADQVQSHSDQTLVAELQQRIRQCQLCARRLRRR